MEIISRKEAKDRGLAYYYTGKPCKAGHISIRITAEERCKECKDLFYEVNRERLDKEAKDRWQRIKDQECLKRKELYHKEKAEDYEAFRLKKKLYRDKYRESLIKGKKRYYQNNKEKCLKKSSEYQRNNREKINEYSRRWRKNRSRKGESAAYRAYKLKRTPVWSDKAMIRDFYLKTPENYHVDHIIPLRGKLVSGFHIETNLQYLEISDNCSKNNKFIPYREVKGKIVEFYS